MSTASLNQFFDNPDSMVSMPVALRRAILGDRIMFAHRLAMNCRDCEDFLKMCIEQLEWVKMAERSIIETLREPGPKPDIKSESVGKMLDSIRMLYRAWVELSRDAADWIALLNKSGYAIDDVRRFKEAEAYATRRVDQFENEDMLYNPSFTESEMTQARKILGN